MVEKLGLKAIVHDRGHFTSDAHALLEIGRGHRTLERVRRQLLDAEADALLIGVGLQHHGLDRVTLLEFGKGFFAGLGPVDVGQMHHAVDAAVETDKQTELGDVANLTFDDGASLVAPGEHNPRILLGLLQAKRDTALVGIDLKHLHFNLLAGGNYLAGMDVLFRPAHL